MDDAGSRIKWQETVTSFLSTSRGRRMRSRSPPPTGPTHRAIDGRSRQAPAPPPDPV